MTKEQHSTTTVGCNNHFSKGVWTRLLAPIRYNGDQNNTSLRGDFIKDQDRIFFSSSFRRLAKKTQVHPLVSNDHIHTRLSHSLEVACVARSIATKVGAFLQTKGHLPDEVTIHDLGEIAYAASLAHDIGNPPFGHAGESAIQDWFASPTNNDYLKELSSAEIFDFLNFDGNAQGFRVVTSLENNKDNGGLRLTYPTLAAFVKYPNSSIESVSTSNFFKNKKFNYYQTEKEHFKTIFSTLNLVQDSCLYKRHPLSYITEAADDICYRFIDIEDAHELKIITYIDIHKVIEPISLELNIQHDKLKKMDSPRRRVSMIRTLIIHHMVNRVVTAFESNYDEIFQGRIFSLIDRCDSPSREYMQNAKKIFYEKIAKEPKKIALEIGAYNTYKLLLDVFIPATFNKIKGLHSSFRDGRALELMGINAPKEDEDINVAYHRVIDFITGMTDDYATFISKQFSGTGTNY